MLLPDHGALRDDLAGADSVLEGNDLHLLEQKVNRIFGFDRLLLKRRTELNMICALIAGTIIGASIPWHRLRERKGIEGALEPLVREARQASLDYEQALDERNASALGKAVLWCVDHPSRGESYVNGNQQRRIRWTNEHPVPINRLTKDRCIPMIARLRGRGPDGVLLEFIAALPSAQIH